MKTRLVKPKITFWNKEKDGENLIRSLESVVTVKHLSRPAGTAVLQMAPHNGWVGNTSRAGIRDYWRNQFSPMDMMSVSFNDDDPAFVGFVDSPKLKHSYTGEKPRRNNQVVLSDLGKLFTKDNLLFLPYLQTWLGKGGPIGQSAEIIKKVTDGKHPLLKPINRRGPFGKVSFNFRSVGEAAQFVLENWSSQRIQTRYSSPSLDTINGLYQTDISYRGQQGSNDPWVDALTDAAGLNTYTGNFWNLLTTIADNQLFYEVFTTVRQGIPTVVMRPTPFDRIGDKIGDDAIIGGSGNSLLNIKDNDPFTWDKLPRTEIAEEDVINVDLQRSDEEAYSIYSIGNIYDLEANVLFSRADLTFAYIDPYALFRYGARTFMPSSQLLRLAKTQKELENLRALSESGQAKKTADYKRQYKDILKHGIIEKSAEFPNIYQRLIAFRDRSFNWYHYNPVMESGTITTYLLQGDKRVNIGERIWCPWMQAADGSQGLEFYVTGVVNHWIFGDTPAITTLVIQRGINDSMRNTYDQRRKSYMNQVQS